MTANHALASQKNGHSNAPCSCGCSPEAPECKLACLVQPRFFCGQLLTDTDLTSLVTWTKEKNRLSRFRHGWGVVCGLYVQCHFGDPHIASTSPYVVISPGYAVDCCGDDIIVCEETMFPLGEICRPEKDPCAHLEKPEDRKKKQEEEQFFEGMGKFKKGDLRVIDVRISYREEPSEPQTAIGRSSCKEISVCEYGRTREGFQVSWHPAMEGSDPAALPAEEWHNSFDLCAEVVAKFADFLRGGDLQFADTRAWLLRWLDTHPLHQFCFLRDWICDEETKFRDEDEVVRALFWIVQDCRNSFLRCDCLRCENNQGVPLARVWLEVKVERGQSRCRVLLVDATPPFRRPLGQDCWPAPAGMVNLGRLIWMPAEEAAAELERLGIRRGKDSKFDLPRTVAKLKEALEGDRRNKELFALVGDTRGLEVFDAGRLGKRVVGFTEGR